MSGNRVIRPSSMAALLLVALLVGFWGQAAAQTGGTLVFGKVSERPHKHYKRYTALVDYVVSRMSDLGIRQGRIELVADNRTLIERLRQGRIDWLTETLYSALLFQKQTGAQIILRRWKQGRPDYRCIFITRKDSGIKSLDDLKGKKIALEDPGSTTGYFIPVLMLRQKGLKLVRLSNPRDTAPPDAVGYTFTQAEMNIAAMVSKGLMPAGAYSSADWENPGNTPPSFRQGLRVFEQSESVPRSLELVRAALPQKIKSRLRQILLRAHEDPQGQAALRAYAGTAKFDEISEPTRLTLDKYRTIVTEQGF